MEDIEKIDFKYTMWANTHLFIRFGLIMFYIIFSNITLNTVETEAIRMLTIMVLGVIYLKYFMSFRFTFVYKTKKGKLRLNL